MAISKCRECGNPVSTSAKACPSCGKPDPAGNQKFGCAAILIIGVGIYGYTKFNEVPPPPKPYVPPVQQTVAAKPAPPPRPSLDITRPMFTDTYAAVCPTSLLYSPLAQHSADNIISAFTSFFGRSQKLKDLGCDEMREGVPVFGEWMENTNQNSLLISFIREGPRRFFTMRSQLRN